MDLDAVHALGRVRHSYGNQFPILARDLPILTANDCIEIGPRFKFVRRSFGHFLQETEIIWIMVIVRHGNVLTISKLEINSSATLLEQA